MSAFEFTVNCFYYLVMFSGDFFYRSSNLKRILCFMSIWNRILKEEKKLEKLKLTVTQIRAWTVRYFFMRLNFRLLPMSFIRLPYLSFLLYSSIKQGDILDPLYTFLSLRHLPPLRFHCVRGCWDRAQDFVIDS